MSSALIIGDGPGGLSAALYLAKNDIETTIFGQDETPMHYAMLYNYLGIPEMAGSEFQEIGRQQATGFGANLVDASVEKAEKTRLMKYVQVEKVPLLKKKVLKKMLRNFPKNVKN